MTTTYPLTKTERRRLSFAIPYYYVNGGSYPGSCNPRIEGVQTFGMTLVDDVTLGASPSDWKQLMEYHRQCGSSLVGTRHTFRTGGGGYSYTFQNKPYGNKCVSGAAGGDLGANQLDFPAAIIGLSSTADALARSKFLARALSARKEFRGGNFLAEFRETIHMLRHPIHGLLSSVKDLAHSVRGIRFLWERGHAKAYKRALGDIWLSFQFGILPFFEDIKDVNKAIANLADGKHADMKPLSASANDGGTTSSWTTQTAAPAVLNSYCKYYKFSKTKSYVRYYGRLACRPESFATIADNFGVSPADIAPAVWEAIPWSFFVDYFLNVQEALDSYQFANTSVAWMMRGYKNISSHVTTGWFVDTSIPQLPDIVSGVGGTVAATTFVTRGIYAGFPYPPFQFRIPGMGSLKWINIGALWAVINGSKPRGFNIY